MNEIKTLAELFALCAELYPGRSYQVQCEAWRHDHDSRSVGGVARNEVEWSVYVRDAVHVTGCTPNECAVQLRVATQSVAEASAACEVLP